MHGVKRSVTPRLLCTAGRKKSTTRECWRSIMFMFGQMVKTPARIHIVKNRRGNKQQGLNGVGGVVSVESVIYDT